MNENLDLIEVQGTAEEKPFSKEEFSTLINLAENGIKDLISLQREIIEDK
jgi:ribonuclease PH